MGEGSCEHKSEDLYSYNVYDENGRLVGTGVACENCGEGVGG